MFPGRQTKNKIRFTWRLTNRHRQRQQGSERRREERRRERESWRTSEKCGKRKRVIAGERRADGGDGPKGWEMEIGVRGEGPEEGKRERGGRRVKTDRVKMSWEKTEGGRERARVRERWCLTLISQCCSSGGGGCLCHRDGSSLSAPVSPTTPLQHITDVHTRTHTHMQNNRRATHLAAATDTQPCRGGCTSCLFFSFLFFLLGKQAGCSKPSSFQAVEMWKSFPHKRQSHTLTHCDTLIWSPRTNRQVDANFYNGTVATLAFFFRPPPHRGCDWRADWLAVEWMLTWDANPASVSSAFLRSTTKCPTGSTLRCTSR